MSDSINGVFCAAATPFDRQGGVDHDRYTAHCRWLLDSGCHGVAMLGTTGEANSLTVSERMDLLDRVLASGIDADQLMPGTGTCTVADSAALTRHAVQAGVRGVVMLPPFYYKGVSDEGLFRAYASTIDAVGDDRLRVILYHIPQMSMIAISHDLIERLVKEFPEIVVGIKDSSGDFDNMTAMCKRFPGFSVFAGADPLMLPLLEAGGAGCITAASNLIPDELRRLYDHHQGIAPLSEDDKAQCVQRITDMRALSNTYMQIPTIKAMMSMQKNCEAWRCLRPPLQALDDTAFTGIRDKTTALLGS